MSVSLAQHWGIEFNSGIPVYKQIINHIRAALASGALKEGDQLPTLRHLHQQLQVNPNTVAKAYRELELRGLITSERGSGTFIKAGAEPARLSKAERQERLESLYRRMLAEAASSGLTESEITDYIIERKNHESV
jgi:GntR family transcriptional regulator